MDAIEGIIKMNKWPPGWDNRWVPHVQWEAIPLQPTKNISWVVPYNWQGLHHFFLVHCLTKYHEVRGHSTPLQGKMSVRVHQNFGLSLSFSAFAIPWASICCSWLAHHWREDLLPGEAHFLHHTLLNEYIYIYILHTPNAGTTSYCHAKHWLWLLKTSNNTEVSHSYNLGM